jgi:hypothetical protein
MKNLAARGFLFWNIGTLLVGTMLENEFGSVRGSPHEPCRPLEDLLKDLTTRELSLAHLERSPQLWPLHIQISETCNGAIEVAAPPLFSRPIRFGTD